LERAVGAELTASADVISSAVVWIQKEFACHTIILYGSRASERFCDNSDYDFVAVRRGGLRKRVECTRGSAFMDVTIYPEAHARAPDPSMLLAMDGIILMQKGRCGTKFLQRLSELHSRGPQVPDVEEVNARRLWTLKMLPRSSGTGSLPHYWRAKLILELLENYFYFRRLWWLGAKKSFIWLNEHHQVAYSAFERALHPASSHDDLVWLVDVVLERHQDCAAE
jgi:uncharacterized protein